MKSTHRLCKPEKFERAFEMRHAPTPAELALSAPLLAMKAHGMKFRRQTVMLGWILDFYCPSSRIAVEADGGYHDHRAFEDRKRDRILFEKHGIITLRFRNEVAESRAGDIARFLYQLHQELPKYRSGTQKPICCATIRILKQFERFNCVATALRNISR